MVGGMAFLFFCVGELGCKQFLKQFYDAIIIIVSSNFIQVCIITALPHPVCQRLNYFLEDFGSNTSNLGVTHSPISSRGIPN